MSESSSLRRLLLPLVPLYRLGLALGAVRYRSPRKLAWPVISIGNLSTGGAGKTPLTIELAQVLTRRGLQVDVLSRGYGRQSGGALRVDPAGTAEQFGDEPLLIAREAGVPVFVASERYDAGVLAESSAQVRYGVHLLDDGFQHRQLARAANILLMNRHDLHDYLLPAGNLREPLSALRRANFIAIPADEPELDQELRARGFAGPIWHLERVMKAPLITGPVVAFCGIAGPEQFFAGLEKAGLHVASRVAFHDHHRYIEHDMDCLKDAVRSVGASALVTTEKDRVRLGALAETLPVPLETARLRVEIKDEDAAIAWLLVRIKPRG